MKNFALFSIASTGGFPQITLFILLLSASASETAAKTWRGGSSDNRAPNEIHKTWGSPANRGLHGTVAAPTLGAYPATTIATAGRNATVNPSVAPTNASSTVAHTSSGFKGLLQVDPTTGVLSITDAHPAGVYTVTVTAYGGGLTATSNFTLTVNNTVNSAGLFNGNTEVGVGSGTRSVAIGDFNGDGKQDFAAANYYTNTVSIRLGDGIGGFSGSTELGMSCCPQSVAIGDFNGDGKQDFALANLFGNIIDIRLGDGTGGFSGNTQVGVGGGSASVALGDFNGDGKQDFAAANYYINTVSIRLGDGMGGFSGSTELAVGNGPRVVAIGDFNSDGKQDFATANFNSNTVSIRLGDGAGGFSGSTEVAAGGGALAIGDFNNDGKQDIAAANFNASTVSIHLGDGAGAFILSTGLGVGPSPLSIATGDFNGDGKQDFVTANYYGANVSIRLGDGAGGFNTNPDVGVGNNPETVAIGDFNSDGKQDFAAVNFSSNSVSIRLGYLLDNCPNDPNKTEPGICGCGVADTDTDNDGMADCIDTCPNDPDNDVDGDGVCGDVDNCPNVANADQADADNNGAGDACDPHIAFSGKIIWEHDDVSGVKDATINLSGSATGSDLSDVNGDFLITTNLSVGSFTLKPVKNINKFNGVNAGDVIAIQQHVGNTNPITDPFKLVCADVNKSNSITTLDASLITLALLGSPVANAIFNTPWRFVPASYTMTNPPWGFPEKRTYTNITTGQSNQDFVGMKIGDVTTAYANPANFGAGEPFILRTYDQVLKTGESLTVEFLADQLDRLAAFQFGLHFDPGQLRLEAIDLAGSVLSRPLGGLPLTADNFGTANIAEGEIRVVWAQTSDLAVAEASSIFRLRFTALQSGMKLSEVLHLAPDDSGLPAKAYTSKIEESEVQLQIGQSTGVNALGYSAANFHLLQNQPNPFNGITSIGFVLPEACTAQLRVLDVNGRELWKTNQAYPKGRNTETLRLDGISVTGILYYELATPFGVLTRKMVKQGEDR